MRQRRAVTGALVCWLAVTSCSGGDEASQVEQPVQSADPTGKDGPGFDLEDRVDVRRDDFQISLILEGVVTQGEAIPIVTERGLVVTGVKDGLAVEEGDAVGKVVVDPELAKRLTSSGTGPDRARLEGLRDREGQARAAVSGILSVGDPGEAVVQSPGLQVEVPLSPVQSLRLGSLAVEGSARVETVAGQREFACDAMWTVTNAGTADGDQPSDIAASLVCRLPPHAETAENLAATLHVQSEPLQDVLVVPNVFVTYDTDADEYSVTLNEGGEDRTIQIDVGPTDGVVRVVNSDLPEGAELVLPDGAFE